MANERFLSHAIESTFGTLPTTGWQRSGVVTNSSVALNRDTVPSNAISGSRGTTNVRPGNDNITGSVALEIALQGLEFWLWNALGHAWTNGASPVDTTGTVRASGAAKGATTIPVTAAVVGAVAANDFVRIGTIASRDTFVRKVVSEVTTGGSETITVDFPIPRAVVASEAVFTVVAPYTNYFKRSTLPTSFSIQHHFEDITQFFKYSGCRINSLAVAVPRTGLATATADIRGKTSVSAGTATGTPTGGGEITPYVSFEAAVEEGGSSYGDMLEFNMNFNNDLDDNIYVLGSRERAQLPEQRGSLTGNISVLFSSGALATKFRDEVESSIELAFANGTSSLTLLLPSVKYTGGSGDPGFENAFGPVLLNNLPYQASYDSGTEGGTDILITTVNSQYIYG